MPHLPASAIVQLVDSMSRVRALTDSYPELLPVARELLSLNGPLPRLGQQKVKEARLGSPAPVTRRRNGLHWTQRPENKAKVAKMLKAAQRARRQSA